MLPDQSEEERAGSPLPPWRERLRVARQREGRSPTARWLQLGTVAADGTPRVRTLVFRGWSGSSRFDVLTDGRSAKVPELEAQPAVELCWLLPRARCQFRLRGQVEIVRATPGSPELHHHWQGLTAGGRAVWGWPEPGEPLDEGKAFPRELPAEAPLPDCFVLLRVALHHVELLDLSAHPHRRWRWCAEDDWSEVRLNP